MTNATKSAYFKSATIGAGNNAKTIKGDKGDSGYVTAILYLKPFKSTFQRQNVQHLR